jgi:hypothetical protein
MAELTVPQVDFSSLGQLPQIYKQAQADNLRQQTLANLGQGGAVDANTLFKSGDLSLAQLGINLRNRQEDQAHSAAREGVADAHQKFMENIALRQANRADDKTPAGFIADPNNKGGYIPIPGGPADPAYLSGIAQAKDPLATPSGRASVAKQYGVDPQSAEGRQFIINGKLPDMTAPNNYEVNPDYGKVEGAPKLRPITGGPADPSVIASDAEAKQGGGLGEGAVEIAARRANAGDFGGLVNVGKGAQGSKNLERIWNKSAEILQKEEGLSPADAAKRVSQASQVFKASQVGQSAEARTGATREANLNLILKATDAAIPAALEASDKVARTGWVPVNKIIQGGEVMSSNPDLKRFGMANLQLAEHWARAMNPTGVMRESDRDKALAFLSTADSKDTYRAAVDQLRTQITRERDAVRGSIPETPQFKGNGSSPVTAPGQPVKIDGYTITEH